MIDRQRQSSEIQSKLVKVGLEVHQQLATPTKLFCGCPPFLGGVDAGVETSSVTKNRENLAGSDQTSSFYRVLRPATSELGELDIAAKFESRREIRVRYFVQSGSSCLVEADEEPPHPISEEAIDTALLFALALGSKIVDEVHVMRKIVVDGSNTSGFQRTAVVALGGALSFNNGKSSVEVQSISVEEDAARALEQPQAGTSEAERWYALDRLGTPLVEVALAPMEGSPEEVEDAAKTLGRLMRSTGRTARGLGTIRQDLNISTMNGKVIEVKGVQRLDQISKVVQFEAARQLFFLELAKELKEKVGTSFESRISDATELFSHSNSQVLRKSLADHDAVIFCIIAPKFQGLFGRENEFHSRLGKELGSIAKSYGLGGIFHSDELPNYGITQAEVDQVTKQGDVQVEDGFILIAGSRSRVQALCEALQQRLRQVSAGVPAETRAASLKGETTFLRPRPGSARMYPETDIPIISIDTARVDALRKQVPERWDLLVAKFAQKYDLPLQLAEPLADSEYKALFEGVVATCTNLAPRYVASVLIDTFQSLARDGIDIYSVKQDKIKQLFEALHQARFAKEATSQILKKLATAEDLSFEEVLSQSGLASIDSQELQKIILQTFQENEAALHSRTRESARGFLMGKIMQKVRGKADGKLISEMLEATLNSYSKEEKVNQ